jgi:hypothetical protein
MIDTTFDFRLDAGGRDPDAYSPTLRRYHQFLWSKPLPDGRPFELDVTTKGTYLHHRSPAGEFGLSSDSVIQTYTRWGVKPAVLDAFSPSQLARFFAIGYTIGGMMVFPGNQVDRKPTINATRGLLRTVIGDRMDLTLECVRRHYLGEKSPLGETLLRYRDFFALFGDFRGYVDFFLLQDLVRDDGTGVVFFAPFDSFASTAIPQDVETYRGFMEHNVAFVQARNERMAAWAASRTKG